jgi:SAM-dependent methyltransferase
MDARIYHDIAQQEETHWWFRARRAIFHHLFTKLNLPVRAKLLDAGCGTGGNLPLLAEFGTVHGFEMHEPSRTHAIARHIGTITDGSLPNRIPFEGTNFDFISLFDVLEHVENDSAALHALHGRLNEGGVLCLNVPAYQWLFGPVDVAHHHFRRYSLAQVRTLVEQAGFTIEYINYWNCLLFPVAAATRLFERLLGKTGGSAGAAIPPAPINKLLATLVAAERFLIPYVRLPFGLSILVLARRRAA